MNQLKTIYIDKTIIEPKSNRNEKNLNKNIKGKNQIRYSTVCIKKMMPLISGILSLTFVIWFLIIFAAAGMNKDKVVLNYFNAYGEFFLEAVFVVVLTVVIIIGLYLNWRRTTQDINEFKKSRL